MKKFNEWLKENNLNQDWVCSDCGKKGIGPIPQICPRCTSKNVTTPENQQKINKEKEQEKNRWTSFRKTGGW